MMKSWRGYLTASIIVALSLCAVQITGNTLLIVAALAAFMLLVFLGSSQGLSLPVLLFFLPWSPLLKLAPGSISFYTLGLVLICAISAVKSWRHFKRYHIVLGILLLLLTLIPKMIGGYSLSLDYIFFMMMIVLFPVVRTEETNKAYSFYEAIIFFAPGIITSAFCAQWFASSYNLAKYIDIVAYKTIIRRSGFYGDPNFYVAHILAAMAGCLMLILHRKKRGEKIVLGLIMLPLLYCGFLSGSKSFVMTAVLVLAIWLMDLMKMRGNAALKLIVVVAGLITVMFIATSSMFSEMLGVFETRLTDISDLDSLTTGRTELWVSYIDKLLDDVRVLFLGEGFTNVKVNGRGSHNTILQTFYQFGLFSTPILIAWMVYYFRTAPGRTPAARNKICKLMLAVGAFLPWVAIDILFFDEFFLMQWFCTLGFYEIDQLSAIKGIEDNG